MRFRDLLFVCAAGLVLLSSCTVQDRCNHEFGDWKVLENATCETEGRSVRFCDKCGKEDFQFSDKTDHDIVIDEGREATCQEEGLTEGSHCSVCNIVIQEQKTIPVTDHRFDSGTVIKQGNCAEDSVIEYKCVWCGFTRTETVAGSGHVFGSEGVVVKEPDCSSEGILRKTCTVCGAEYDEPIPRSGEHSFDKGEVIKKGSCTEPGTIRYTCKLCGATKTEETPASSNHKFDKGVITVPATCGTEGEIVYTCTNCGATRKEKIAKTEHVYSEYVVTKEATCTEEGIVAKICTICGASEEEAIPPIGHKWSKATCSAPATCYLCGATTGTITAHHYTAQVVSDEYLASPATTESEALYYYSCVDCGKASTKTFSVGEKIPVLMDVSPKNTVLVYSGQKSSVGKNSFNSVLTASGPEGEYVWESDDPDILSVNEDGTVVPHFENVKKGSGSETVNVTCTCGDTSDTVTVTVYEMGVVPDGMIGENGVKRVELSELRKTVTAGESFTLTAKVLDSKGKDITDSVKVTWSYSDSSVASAYAGGLVVSLNPGTAKVYVSVDGLIWAACTVTVTE